MSNIVATAINAAARLYGTNEQTQWFVTFTTNDTKHGRLTSLDDGFFSLCDGRSVYIFHTEQVVHVSPQFPPGQNVDTLSRTRTHE